MSFLEGLSPALQKELHRANEVHSERLPLASKRLTRALNGGIGRGRNTIVYGNTSAGKSAMIMQSIALWQEMDLSVAYFDVEQTFDGEWAQALGVDTEELIVYNASRSMDKIINMVDHLLQNNIDVLVVDSISMALPGVFVGTDGDIKEAEDTNQIGAHAKACAKLCSHIAYSNTNTAVVLVSQTTTEFGATYTKQIPHGGKKTLFAATQIIKLTSSNTDAKQKKGAVMVNGNPIAIPVGRSVEFIIEKNKLGPQSQSGAYDFFYAGDFVGVDLVGEIADDCVKYGIINKKGSWLMHGEDESLKWHGRDTLIADMRDSFELKDRLEQELSDAV